MTRRLEAGPLLVALGALLLVVSLFLNWFAGEVTAWQAFEVWDVALLVLGLSAIVTGIGLATQQNELVDRRLIPPLVAVVAVVVASQIIDPPPAAAGQDPDTGAWLALGAALVMCAGAVLTFGRVGLAVTVEGRDSRQRVSAVDARGSREDTTDSHEPVRPGEREEGAGEPRLFGPEREPAAGARAAGAKPAAEPSAEPHEAGTETRDAKQD